MRQPEVWAHYAQTILATGQRPHFAPSEEILAIQREHLARFVAKHGSGRLAVILGATPELADLALASGCRVIRVDSNPAMFEAAAIRQNVLNRINETVVVGDWLRLDMIEAGTVDVVLGDSSLNNVPHGDMATLIQELARITHAGSIVALRQIVLPDELIPEGELPAAVTAFREGRINADEFHRILRFYSCRDDGYDPASRVFDASKVFAAIEREYRAGTLNDDEFDFLMSRYSTVRHTVYPFAEQQRALEALGACEAISPGPGCAGDLFKVFVVTVSK